MNQEHARRQRMNDLRTVMGTEQGRRVIWSILEAGNLFRECFTGNSNTYHMLGARTLALKLRNELCEACLELVHKAERENREGEDNVR